MGSHKSKGNDVTDIQDSDRVKRRARSLGDDIGTEVNCEDVNSGNNNPENVVDISVAVVDDVSYKPQDHVYKDAIVEFSFCGGMLNSV
ncbi:hypothetical protein [Borrelia sp. RT1S]|uniref:hypothetical protein n=1 Tax=Borrelia sp. RT1S TaxID=2898580 RepID=UPI001E3E4A11|nr:hypothetical protein [Borrelia sp. RT1S]UGQ17737.1 hypothetical protein LSO05_04735 [Borrelia sp. RT1S]